MASVYEEEPGVIVEIASVPEDPAPAVPRNSRTVCVVMDDTDAGWSALNNVCAALESPYVSHQLVVLIQLAPPWWSLLPVDAGNAFAETLWELLCDHRGVLADRAKLTGWERGIDPRIGVRDAVQVEREVAHWRRSEALIIDFRTQPLLRSGMRRVLRALRGMVA